MHHLTLTAHDKTQRYQEIIPQLQAVISAETDPIANMANTAAILKTAFEWLWVGFYRCHDYEMILGPFQGPLACTRIPFSKGICGRAYQQDQIIMVGDVQADQDHIACSSLSQSEIVLPIHRPDRTIAYVLDIDSEHLHHFDEIDSKYLGQIVLMLEQYLFV